MTKATSQEHSDPLAAAVTAEEKRELGARAMEQQKVSSAVVEVTPDPDAEGISYTLSTKFVGEPPETGNVCIRWYLVPRNAPAKDAHEHAVLKTEWVEVPASLLPPRTKHVARPVKASDWDSAKGLLITSAENPLVATLDVTDLPEGDYDVLATFRMEAPQ